MSFISKEMPGCSPGRPWVAAALLAAVLAAAPARPAPAADERHTVRRDRVLGTSYDLTVVGGSRKQAEACHRAVLAEIERLSDILNARDPKSEISRLAAADGPFKCSPDLFSVMLACEGWRIRTGGAFNASVGELFELWRTAAKVDKLPDAQSLAAATGRLKSPAWRLDMAARAVRPAGKLNVRVDGLAKGYIIDKALAAGRTKVPGLKGLLLDIGGDIGAWSAPGAPDGGAWVVDVADPFRSEDNAPPMATVRLVNQSVATSGSYARYFKIRSKRHSQIIDPRTGRPAYGVVSATVVARNTVTADAAATALCVMSPQRGLALANRLRQTECLIVGSDGKTYRSRNWGGLKSSKPTANSATTQRPEAGRPDPARWPKGYCVSIRLSLKSPPPRRRKRKKYERPYVAVMVFDSNNEAVKTVALWVERKTKYDKDLRAWYSQGRSYRAKYRRAVSRATRSPGSYTLVWDGTDDDGKPVKRGTYGIFIEINREHGTHVYMKADITCQAAAASGRMPANTESDGVSIRYGPRGR